MATLKCKLHKTQNCMRGCRKPEAVTRTTVTRSDYAWYDTSGIKVSDPSGGEYGGVNGQDCSWGGQESSYGGGDYGSSSGSDYSPGGGYSSEGSSGSGCGSDGGSY